MVNRKAAIELSIGTIVILVLAMSMLILGLVLVRSIFSTATGAIGDIDKGVRDAIIKTLADPSKKLAIYPSARTIEIKQATQGKGFAFSLRNTDVESKTFNYAVIVDPSFEIMDKCKINAKEAQSWIIVDKGSITLGRGATMEDPVLVLYNMPEDAPPCTIPYKIQVANSDGSSYVEGTVYLTVQSK